jgi:hypothetical protein
MANPKLTNEYFRNSSVMSSTLPLETPIGKTKKFEPRLAGPSYV